MNLTAVIVTHNRCQKLQHTLAATLAQPFSAIIVVDNASTDGTRAWLAGQHDPRLHLILSEQNSGGAGGFAQGMIAALNYDPDWLVCYDDDAYPAPDALQQFTALDLGNTDSAAAAVYYPDGRLCEMNRPSYNPFWHPRKLLRTALGVFTGRARGAFHVTDSAYQGAEALPIDSSSFVGFFVRADWVRRLPLPEPGLFIYGDDVLYTLNLTKHGARHRFLPTVRFIHDCSTFQTARRGYHPLWKAYFTYRNGLLIYRMAAGVWFYPVALLKALLWLAAVRHYRNKRLYLRLWWQAVRDGIRQDLSRDPAIIIQQYQDDAPAP
ncbi:glycosyltransferase [Cardiobacterium hominis]|uniref:glycosyltransferase n=1 Tax=Cardiobacterium hominis TaxID=2718 RepID=UPI002493C271|nr:glycosyltransferase [Cardiobacterium hominis]